MIKLYYICSLKSSIFLNFFKLDNQFFCRALKYIILRRKKLDKIILYKFYLILINLIYLLLITEKLFAYKLIKVIYDSFDNSQFLGVLIKLGLIRLIPLALVSNRLGVR